MLLWMAIACLIFLSPAFAVSVGVVPAGELLVYIPGADPSFSCSTSGGVVSAQWFLNGTLYEENLMNVVITPFFSAGGSQIGVLDFSDLPLEYNTTTIQCRAEVNNTGEVLSSMNSTILIQGPLPAVGSLMVTQQDSTIFLNWTAPDSLDKERFSATGYCVDVVVNSTSSPILYSECEVTTTEFTYPIPPGSGCNSFLFTVTPVNVLGNGTELTTPPYSGPETSPEVRDVFRIGVSPSSLPPIYTYSLNMSAPVCSSELTFLDLDSGEMLIDSELTVEEDNITFTTEQLTVNRGYNVSVTASNSAGSATSYTTISTHDVVNAMPTTSASMPNTRAPTGNTIGIVVGVVVGNIILIAIAVAVLIAILVVKKKLKVGIWSAEYLGNNNEYIDVVPDNNEMPPSSDAAEMQAVYDDVRQPNRGESESESTAGLLNSAQDPDSGAPQINKSKKAVDDHKNLNYEVVVTKKPTEGKTFEVSREMRKVIYSEVKPHTRGDEAPAIPPKATQPVDENTAAGDDSTTNV